MPGKAVRIKRLDKFLEVADAVIGPKFLDVENGIAFYNIRYKRMEYAIIDDEDVKRLLQRDFIECQETEFFESW
jgi:hypothetical protein